MRTRRVPSCGSDGARTNIVIATITVLTMVLMIANSKVGHSHCYAILSLSCYPLLSRSLCQPSAGCAIDSITPPPSCVLLLLVSRRGLVARKSLSLDAGPKLSIVPGPLIGILWAGCVRGSYDMGFLIPSMLSKRYQNWSDTDGSNNGMRVYMSVVPTEGRGA